MRERRKGTREREERCLFKGKDKGLPVDRVKIGVVHRKMEVYNNKRRNSCGRVKRLILIR